MNYLQLLQIKLDEIPHDYFEREWKKAHKKIQDRSKLGLWKEEDIPDPKISVNRISWLLAGDYGSDLAYYAWHMIDKMLTNKTGKNLDNAIIAAGRELTMLVTLFDTTEYTFRKITEIWKKQGVDFKVINEKAAAELIEWLDNEIQERKG